MLAIDSLQTGEDVFQMKISDLKQKWKDKTILIVGCGATGLSVAKFLHKNGIEFTIADSRENVTDISVEDRQYQIISGEFRESVFENSDILIVSPGVSIKHPYIQKAIHQNKEVIGDVELFCQLTDKPIIAITGSNGKSTVTTLVGKILNALDIDAEVGGNIGIPSLDLLQEHEPQCYILELSSFQLETTSSLKAIASVVLNLSEDHMDRYDSFAEYINAKKKILNNSESIVVNIDDPLVVELSESIKANKITFGLDLNKNPDFYIDKYNASEWVFQKSNPLLDISNLKVVGQHNKQNILAALSLCSVFEVELSQAVNVLNEFTGLEHRSQVISHYNNVTWINDSKATNIGATSAALKGFSGNDLFLILGGQAKGQKFSDLLPAITSNVKHIFVFGEDSNLIFTALKDVCEAKLTQSKTLEQVIELIRNVVKDDDVVLFSPACASFDQFDNYMHRGKVFTQTVLEKVEGVKS